MQFNSYSIILHIQAEVYNPLCIVDFLNGFSTKTQNN